MQFADLRGGGAWQERGGGVFDGGVDTPMHTVAYFCVFIFRKYEFFAYLAVSIFANAI